VYNFLASLADCNQRCFPSQKYIAEKLGCSRSTINKAVKVLAKYGLVKVERKNRYHCTYLLVKLRCNTEETQVSRRGNSDVSQMNTNDNKRIIYINNIDKRKTKPAELKKFKEFKPKTREDLLALDLARDLDDYQGLPFYISISRKYSESFLRGILGQIKSIPSEKIKKSKGALFNHLVQRYGKKTYYP
jgi:biotin operon repressor